MSPSSDEQKTTAVILQQRIEHIVDRLPEECIVAAALKNPRFVNAVLVLPHSADNGKLLKAILRRQLDRPEPPADEAKPEKRIDSLRRKFESSKTELKAEQQKQHWQQNGNGGNEKEELLLLDAIGEAVRILREAGEKLDRKLDTIGRPAVEKPQTKIERKMETVVAEAPPPVPKHQEKKSVPNSIANVCPTNGGDRQRRPPLFASGISFPSELRKYRTATTVDS